MLELEFEKLSRTLNWSHFTPKSCRKFFKSQLQYADINNAFIEFWMGHSVRRVEGAYFVDRLRENPEEQMALYKKSYSHLKLPFGDVVT